MISIEFDEAPEWVDSEKAREKTERSSAALVHTLFLSSVRIRADGIELLEGVKGGLSLPILGLASLELRKIRRLPSSLKEEILLSGAGHLLLDLEGENVRLFSTQTDRTVVVPYKELVTAWSDFADRVRKLLFKKFPDLLNHPDVGAWFRGEEWPTF